jgi:hypothetical protein
VNHPMGENFPNLVTLFLANQTNWRRAATKYIFNLAGELKDKATEVSVDYDDLTVCM